MNKVEFKKYMASRYSITQEEANNIIDVFTDGIMSALSDKHEVQLIGFGNFFASKVETREGRNPRTGEKLQIKSYYQPRFKVSQKLKNAVNK